MLYLLSSITVDFGPLGFFDLEASRLFKMLGLV